MTTLADFEREISRLAALGFDLTTDEWGRALHQTAEREACFRLRALSQQIRSMCWRSPVAAYIVAAHADEEAERVGLLPDAGGGFSGPWPILGSVGKPAGSMS